MNLFEFQVPEDKLHPNFKNILIPQRENERRLLSQWANGFVDRDKKLVKEFQTTFNSTFWEIRSGPQFSDMTLSGRSVLIVPNNTGTDYD
ncbi:hypothetical protein [Vibrio parahaemolyticus]|uniref:hypothetical protein n=1 Tax=Vibrio parahaemolyticus TaxID=670 RepID=UPI0007B69FA6|nr:hypothetical protein [Vibrio parahaemolyticus]ANB96729.1 hypothetical protein FORC14_1912 [Vibrio parahaemolyticus]